VACLYQALRSYRETTLEKVIDSYYRSTTKCESDLILSVSILHEYFYQLSLLGE